MGFVFWIVVVIGIVFLRLLGLLVGIRRRRRSICAGERPPVRDWSRMDPDVCKVMVVLGSGGHTAEALEMIDQVLGNDPDPMAFRNVVYVVANTDSHSASKAAALHMDGRMAIEFHMLPRAREVGQSYLTSVFTTLRALIAAFYVVFRERPSILLVNGPGTCVPVVFAAILFNVFGVTHCRSIYIESVARVKVNFHHRAQLLLYTLQRLLNIFTAKPSPTIFPFPLPPPSLADPSTPCSNPLSTLRLILCPARPLQSLSLSGKILYPIVNRFVVQWPQLRDKYPLAEYYGRLV